MSKTQDNLAAAFAGESQANRKYLAYAAAAEKEGNLAAAKVFRVAAEAETIHAINHFRNMGKIKSLKENLEDAIAGENYEATKMYPEFLAVSKEENENAAGTGFSWALEVEKLHEKMFRETLGKLESGEKIEDQDFYICPLCGYPASPEAPDACPVCGAPKEKFYKL